MVACRRRRSCRLRQVRAGGEVLADGESFRPAHGVRVVLTMRRFVLWPSGTCMLDVHVHMEFNVHPSAKKKRILMESRSIIDQHCLIFIVEK